ncbi:MAG: phosphate transport system protein [Lentimonas sp.]|jgi:phosphate transport system protein
MELLREHTVKSYDKDLKSISSTLDHIVDLLQESAKMVKDVIENPKKNLTQEISDHDYKINQLDNLTEKKVTAMLALRQPMALDLRYVVSALKVSSNLERVGDKCKSIIKKFVYLDTPIDYSTKKSLLEMFDIATKMTIDSVLAFNSANGVEQADLVLKQDDQIDKIYKNLLFNAEEGHFDSTKIKNVVNILFIAKSFERMADHATNIAELTQYVISGEIIE